MHPQPNLLLLPHLRPRHLPPPHKAHPQTPF
jgi:hypothetical protein